MDGLWKRPIEGALKVELISSGVANTNDLPQVLSQCWKTHLLSQELVQFIPTATTCVNNWVLLIKKLKDSAVTICQGMIDIFSRKPPEELWMLKRSRIFPLQFIQFVDHVGEWIRKLLLPLSKLGRYKFAPQA